MQYDRNNSVQLPVLPTNTVSNVRNILTNGNPNKDGGKLSDNSRGTGVSTMPSSKMMGY